MRDLSDVVLKPSDFAVLAELCRLDLEFPATFDQWAGLIATAETQARERRLFPQSVLLDPKAFEGWCQKVAIVPCLDALRAYAIVQRGQSSPSSIPV